MKTILDMIISFGSDLLTCQMKVAENVVEG